MPEAPRRAGGSLYSGTPTEPRRRPVILFVGAFPPPGYPIQGGNISDCRTLLGSSFPERAVLELVDSTQRSIPAPSLPVRAWFAIGRMLRVARLLSRKPDAMLLLAAGGFSLAEKSSYAWLGRMFGVRSLLFVRAGEVMERARRSRWYKGWVGLLIGGADRLLCQGESWRRFFVEVMGLPPERCPVVMNWTATPALLSVGASRSYDERPGHRILFLGWLSVTKGLMDLLEAFADVVKDGASVQLDVAGAGEASDSARAFVRLRGLEDQVVFHGWVDGAARLALLADADIFALPSHHEGMPNAVIEAMAAGLPIVVTPVGAVLDAVDDDRHAVIVPVGDPGRLAAALRGLLGSRDRRERLGRAAHARAAEHFTVEGGVERLLWAVGEVTGTDRERRTHD